MCEIDLYTPANQEVDFLILDQQRKLRLIQVCETLASPVTRQREISALQPAMNELGLSEASMVTRDDGKKNFKHMLIQSANKMDSLPTQQRQWYVPVENCIVRTLLVSR